MTAVRKVPPIGITVNGEDVLFSGSLTVRQLLAKRELPEKGIAIAVDGMVYPKSKWDDPIQRGWAIEILTAVQGG
jgi:sulfur carrier protein